MKSQFLGLVLFEVALQMQSELLNYVAHENSSGEVLGFECEPVVTLGVRGSEKDLRSSRAYLSSLGYQVLRVDRGGQATIHNPGQLVIFPVLALRGLGTRHWVNLLLRITRTTLRHFGCESECREGQPGLYTSKGKIASIGVRVREGVSTHGIAINIHNELADFGLIRACGVSEAAIDQLGGPYRLQEVFDKWMEIFNRELPLELTNPAILPNLDPSRARL